MKIRVLIVDDHARFRSVLRNLLELDPGIEVVAEASDGYEALSRAKACSAQVVCTDFRMAGMDGAETTRQLLAAMPGLKVIGLSAGFESNTETRMLAAGASKYVPKAHAADELVPAIHALLAQEEDLAWAA